METFSTLLVLCAVNSLVTGHKGQWHGALILSLICTWINGWVNNREAGDLRCNHAHYDITVMMNDCCAQWVCDFRVVLLRLIMVIRKFDLIIQFLHHCLLYFLNRYFLFFQIKDQGWAMKVIILITIRYLSMIKGSIHHKQWNVVYRDS